MADHSKDLILRTCWPSFSIVAFDIFSIDASISRLISSVIEPESEQYLPGKTVPGKPCQQNLTNKALRTNFADKTLHGQNLIYSLPKAGGNW